MKLCHRAKQKSEAAFEPATTKKRLLENPLDSSEILRKVLRNLLVSFQNWLQIGRFIFSTFWQHRLSFGAQAIV